MRWEVGFQGLRRGEKRSIQHVCEHFHPKRNAEITFPARLFRVRHGARLAYHRNLHLTRFCRQTKKGVARENNPIIQWNKCDGKRDFKACEGVKSGAYNTYVSIFAPSITLKSPFQLVYFAYETARVSRITVIFT